MAVVGPTIVPVCHSAGDRVPHDGRLPLPTITTAKGGELAVAAARVAPYPAAAAFIEEHQTGSVGQAASQPLGTQTQKDHHAVVAAWMVQHNTGVIGHHPLEPTSTLTTLGTQQQVAAAYITEFRGSSLDGQRITEPVATLCTGGNRGGGHSGVTAAFLAECPAGEERRAEAAAPGGSAAADDPTLSTEQLARAREIAVFLRRYGCWSGGDLVTLTIGGTTWLVVDIGMRMLTAAEAAAAHELKLPVEIEVDGKRRPLTKTEAMRLIGNSVPQRMAYLIARCNVHHALDGLAQREAAGAVMVA
ncbi:hypothetical protein [Azospirillum sp. sgz302134]